MTKTPAKPAPTLDSLQAQITQQAGDIATLKSQVVGLLAPKPSGMAMPKFLPSSWCYQQIPANAPLHPNSANFAANLKSQVPPNMNVGVNVYQYTPPVFIADQSWPIFRVEATDYVPYGILAGLQDMFSAVPIPTYAAPSAGTDAEMVVYQPSTDTLWEFWAASNDTNGWHAPRGGRMLNVGSNPASWLNPDFGVTATRIPFAAGLVTAEELSAGEIKHVIGFAVGRAANWDKWSYPAIKSDGYDDTGNPNFIPEGIRFRLDPTLDVNALGLTPIGKIIARAGQVYGFVVWDQTGGDPSIRFVNASSYTLAGKPDPYPALFGGLLDYQLLAGLPLDRMQFLPMDYGRPS